MSQATQLVFSYLTATGTPGPRNLAKRVVAPPPGQPVPCVMVKVTQQALQTFPHPMSKMTEHLYGRPCAQVPPFIGPLSSSAQCPPHPTPGICDPQNPCSRLQASNGHFISPALGQRGRSLAWSLHSSWILARDSRGKAEGRL
jgi:hypothetical protein